MACGVVEPERAESLRAELAWLGGVLGAVRDLDVLTVHLKSESEVLEPAEQTALKPLFRRLAAERRKARSALTRALNSKRYARLLADLEEVVGALLPTNGSVKLDSLAGKEFGRLVKSMKALGNDPEDDELHHVRILGKRARYAAELAEPEGGKAARRVVARAKSFQDVLGAHQDAIVAEARLRGLLADQQGSGAAFAAGRLVEQERQRRREARAELPEAWKALDREARRAWG